MSQGQVTVRICDDAEQVSRDAAQEVALLAGKAIAAGGRFTMALSGGSTPRRLYEILAEPPFREQIDWRRVELFWGDERCVPPDHPDSNYRMTKLALLDKVGVPAANVHRLAGERKDLAAAASEYQVEIAKVFGQVAEGAPPSFDLVLLGMGPDGHTASLFPHTAALKETTRWVAVNHVPKFNADRLTLTRPILNRAACVMFLIAGDDKAEPLSEVLEGPPDPERLPSQLIQPAGTLVWLIDRAAAARLRKHTH
jgi:6-phosphogluconolactonase